MERFEERTTMNRVRLRKPVTITIVACLVCASTLIARGGPDRSPKPKDVTMAGMITDLHSYATGESQPTRAVQRLIRGGMPAVLETDKGPILLGSVSKQYRKELLKLVHEDVEVEGKLYEKRGLRYLDIIAMGLADSGDYEYEDEEVEVRETEKPVEPAPNADEAPPDAPTTEEPDPDAP